MNFDTINQIRDVFDGVAPVPFGFVEGQETVNVFLNAHHPAAVSLLFALFIRLGLVFGSAGIGVTLYIVCQMALAAAIFARAISELSEYGVSARAGKILLLFYALLPIFPFYICNMLKNSLHSLLCVVFFLDLLRMIYGRPDRRHAALRWILLSVLLCLTQNTGIYLVIATDLALLLSRIRGKRASVSAAVCACLMFLVLPNFVYPACRIYPGGKQEILGTLFQQTARVMRDHPEDVSPEDREIIDRVLDADKITELFDPETVDPVKATYRMHATGEDLRAYFALWFRMGLRYPGDYLRTTGAVCGAFFAPFGSVAIFSGIPVSEGILSDVRHVMPSRIRDAVVRIYHICRDLPVLGVLFWHMLYTWWIPLYAAYRRGNTKEGRLILVPTLIQILFLIVSPVLYSRYALGLILTSPLLLLIVLQKPRCDRVSDKSDVAGIEQTGRL